MERCSRVEVHAGDLGHLARRVAGAVASQRPLDREQGEAPGGDRLAQLRHRDPLGCQLLEQGKAGPARLALDALQQALGVEVDLRALRHGRHSARRGAAGAASYAVATAPPRRGSPPPLSSPLARSRATA